MTGRRHEEDEDAVRIGMHEETKSSSDQLASAVENEIFLKSTVHSDSSSKEGTGLNGVRNMDTFIEETIPSGAAPPLFPKRRQESDLYSKLTFAYMNPIIRTGIKRELSPDDYMPVEDADNSETLSSHLIASWEAEMRRANASPKGPTSVRLWRAVAAVFGWGFVWPGLVSLLETFVKIGEALMLGVLLRWFQDPNSTSTQGYLYALALSGCVLMHAVLHHIEFFLAMRIGMQIRIAFITTIYRKCLALSISHTSSTGLIVNLVSNDVQRFEDAAPFAHFIWLGPVEVLLITYFMYLEIGFAAFAAVGALLALIPIQGGFARQFSSLRKRTVGYRDDRIKSISDSLAGIMVVKLYAWEEPFKKSINSVRDQEMHVIRKASVLRAMNEAFYFASPAVIEIFAFLTYWLMGGELTPAKKALQFISESLVSLNRIQSFLSLPEMTARRNEAAEAALLEELNDPTVDIVIQNGNFSWGANGLESGGASAKTILRNLDITVKRGESVAVVGPVGSGKSSLLNALLGEMEPLPGTRMAIRSRKIAYCTQTPFILSGSIKDNITFGRPLDEKWLSEVIKACAMDSDIKLFSDGVETVIGERGVTLSGGQRARLALARAVYSNADIYLLDDPLSAVDTKVGRHLFEKCINGILKEKTRILVTHQLQFSRRCSSIILLENGTISAKGDHAFVISTLDSSFASTMKEMDAGRNKSADGEEEDEPDVDALFSDASAAKVEVEEASPKETKALLDPKEDIPSPRKSSGGLIKKEESASGSVPLSTYITFFRSGSTVIVATILFILLVMGQITILLTNWYLSRWSLLDYSSQRWFGHAVIFLALAIGTLVVSLGRSVMFFTICLNATETIFRKMISSSFFEGFEFKILGTFAIAVTIIPWVLFSVPVIGIVFFYLRKYYIASSRQIKRYEAVTRSPVYSNIPATLEGLSTIRAFGNERAFRDSFIALQNENTRIFFCFLSAARWLGFRLDVLSAAFLILVAFLAVAIRTGGGLNPGVVGLLLSYALQLMGLLQWAVRQSAEVENLMVSVERILEYTNLTPEAPSHTDVKPPTEWPNAGEIAITNMSMAYPNTDRQVLKDVTVHIPAGTKVGVVGRTGAGKSSLLQALFRLVEPTPENSIVIDSIPTTSLGLEDLRSRISIIPQEPFCFKGTLRFNLDPFGKYEDAALWKSLEGVELKRVVESMPEKLESFVAENGSNWSVGERQLICLARAILRNSKLIVMDEATSAVDMRTDALVQQAIRSTDGLFASSTVLTIAHRLQTVIDFDMILVLSDGRVVEYGSPHDLLLKDVSDPSSWFHRMVSETSPETQEQLRGIAKEKAMSRK
ncbi:Multidrug resistance-associated protein 4 [Dinochytrium kinnereticum]|nr:Multidrug resistance-associated protein 4 [Dinochytrium kinnereticum]